MPSGSKIRERVLSIGDAAANVCVVMCGVSAIAGFFGALWWIFDLFANFRVQYGLALLLASVFLFVRRRWLWGGLATVGAIVNLALVVPLFVGPTPPTAPPSNPLAVLAFNVNYQGGNAKAVATYIGSSDADLVLLLEATPLHVEAVAAALPGFDVIAKPRSDAFGIALFSRSPLREPEIIYLGPDRLPAVVATIEHGADSYSFIGVHTMPPIGGRNAVSRDHYLRDVALWLTSAIGHTVVVGDLNATPWSSAFRRLVGDAELVNSQDGFGVQASWPAEAWYLAIPIDHLLHDRGLITTERRLGPQVGSDHRPLHVTLAPRGGG